jgi:hypothetical protein
MTFLKRKGGKWFLVRLKMRVLSAFEKRNRKPSLMNSTYAHNISQNNPHHSVFPYYQELN